MLRKRAISVGVSGSPLNSLTGRCRVLSARGLLREAPRGFTFRTKVNSRSPNPHLLIALHSPNGLCETGLRMCPSEKSQDEGLLRYQAVRSLQSGLSGNNREIRACFAYFGVRGAGISLHFRLRGGEAGIRTLGTGVSPYNGLANRRIRPLCHLSGCGFH